MAIFLDNALTLRGNELMMTKIIDDIWKRFGGNFWILHQILCLGCFPTFSIDLKKSSFFKIHRDKSWKEKGGLKQTLCACDNFWCFFSSKHLNYAKMSGGNLLGSNGRWLASRPCESRRNFRRMHLDRKSQFSTLARMVHAVHCDKRICMSPKTWGKGNKKNKDQEGSGEFFGVFAKLNRKKKTTQNITTNFFLWEFNSTSWV